MTLGRRPRRAANEPRPPRWVRLRSERGNAVAEFPLISTLIVALALSIIQLSLFLYVRGGITDAAVQGAYYAALQGNDVDQGVQRARDLTEDRFGSLVDVEAEGDLSADGTVRIVLRTSLPIIGFFGPANALEGRGHAVKEESL